MAPEARSRSTRRLTAGADSPTRAPTSAYVALASSTSAATIRLSNSSKATVSSGRPAEELRAQHQILPFTEPRSATRGRSRGLRAHYDRNPGGADEGGADRRAAVVRRPSRPDPRRGPVPGQGGQRDRQVGDGPDPGQPSAQHSGGQQGDAGETSDVAQHAHGAVSEGRRRGTGGPRADSGPSQRQADGQPQQRQPAPGGAFWLSKRAAGGDADHRGGRGLYRWPDLPREKPRPGPP